MNSNTSFSDFIIKGDWKDFYALEGGKALTSHILFLIIYYNLFDYLISVGYGVSRYDYNVNYFSVYFILQTVIFAIYGYKVIWPMTTNKDSWVDIKKFVHEEEQFTDFMTREKVYRKKRLLMLKFLLWGIFLVFISVLLVLPEFLNYQYWTVELFLLKEVFSYVFIFSAFFPSALLIFFKLYICRKRVEDGER